MQWDDSKNRYGLVSVINHWGIAFLVIVLAILGQIFSTMEPGPERAQWVYWHLGLGTLGWLWLAFRVAWRLFKGELKLYRQTAALMHLTWLVQSLLLVLIAALILTGPWLIWAKGDALEVFGLISIPSMTGPFSSLHDVLDSIHRNLAMLLIPIMVMHLILGVIQLRLAKRQHWQRVEQNSDTAAF